MYSGEMKENQKCGSGVQIWKDGSIYEGYLIISF